MGIGTERKSNERVIIIEGGVIGLGRHLLPGNLPGIDKEDDRKDSYQ